MSFRQNNETTRKWNAFYQANRDLIDRSGVPESIVETWDLFADLLMHGYIDHHVDPTHFTIKELTPEQLGFFRQLVDKYYESGFPDPGICYFVTGGIDGWIEFVKKYPATFGPRSVEFADTRQETHNDQQ